MNKFRKLELIPLTNIKDLNLNIVKESKLEIERNDEIDLEIAKLFSFLKNNDDIFVTSKFGDEDYLSTQIKPSSNKKIYTFPEPNPICIYFNIANEHLKESFKLKNEIINKKQNFNFFEDYKYFSKYFSVTSQGIIFLITTIEGFINQFFIEESYIINGETKTKKELEYAKLDEKISIILPIITGKHFKITNHSEYSNILNTNKLRNDLIHLKQIEINSNIKYQELFRRTFNFNQLDNSNAVFTFLNELKPNYFKEDDNYL
uniref:hypothetical protein n=1 Tax=Gelidibacter sp. TaxID=2018083 RepID=UPI00404A3692